jgi:predicted DNA-binding protein with PD1-like motif
LGGFNWQTKTHEVAAEFREQLKVLSLIGDVAFKDGKPVVHAHLIVGWKDGTAHGGNLCEARSRQLLVTLRVTMRIYVRRS